MKVLSKLSPIKNSYLYIPHGSDESYRVECQSLKLSTFISHMVQMKVDLTQSEQTPSEIFISHMVQMKDNSDLWI